MEIVQISDHLHSTRTSTLSLPLTNKSLTPSFQILSKHKDLLSSFHTGISTMQTSQPATNTISHPIIKLTHENIFRCMKCQKADNQYCQICQHQKQLSGNNNIVQFMEYIIQFKLGVRKSYQNHKTKQSKKNKCYADNYSSISKTHISGKYSIDSLHKVITNTFIQQKCQQVKHIHNGYECDICKITPIQGSRFHCMICQNYDLCEKCRYKHGHQLKQYKTSSTHHQMVGVLTILNKSQIDRQSVKSITKSQLSTYSCSLR